MEVSVSRAAVCELLGNGGRSVYDPQMLHRCDIDRVHYPQWAEVDGAGGFICRQGLFP